jgi:hypothetical protein
MVRWVSYQNKDVHLDDNNGSHLKSTSQLEEIGLLLFWQVIRRINQAKVEQ